MTKRYGVPYKGSKNQIAESLIERLPSATNFVDLFCGGCAITHAALQSGKWKSITGSLNQKTCSTTKDIHKLSNWVLLNNC